MARICAALACILVVSGCTFRPRGFDGNWIGPLTPLSGSCDPSSGALLTVRGEHAIFTPNEGVILLRGTVDAAGAVSTSVQLVGMDRRPYVLVFRGTVKRDGIAGKYLTPRCRATVLLKRR